MRLQQTAMTLIVLGVFSLGVAPMVSYAQRGGSDSESSDTVESISCKLFPEDCSQPVTRGLPQRPSSERPPVVSAAPEPITFHIHFATNSDEIPATHYAELDKLGKAISTALERRPQARIEIAGHTDSAGSGAYNQTLSEKRAASVKRYLVDKYNIAADSLSVKGYGESSPIASNNTIAGRQMNRRVVAERTK